MQPEEIMPANIEIKARVRELEDLKARAAALSYTPVEIIPQVDTFFQAPQGRLKLRELAPNLGQLIYYERDDSTGPKQSNYFIAETADPVALKTTLAAALGIRGEV